MDLHREQGRDVVRALAERADVLVENFRPGVMAALPEMLSRAARPACHALHLETVRASQPRTRR